MARVHELKCVPPYFSMVRLGIKPFEVRLDDRGFIASDQLLLKEWIDDTQQFTGEEFLADVTFVLHGGRFGIERGYVVMGIKPATTGGEE